MWSNVGSHMFEPLLNQNFKKGFKTVAIYVGNGYRFAYNHRLVYFIMQ